MWEQTKTSSLKKMGSILAELAMFQRTDFLLSRHLPNAPTGFLRTWPPLPLTYPETLKIEKEEVPLSPSEPMSPVSRAKATVNSISRSKYGPIPIGELSFDCQPAPRWRACYPSFTPRETEARGDERMAESTCGHFFPTTAAASSGRS